MADIKKYQGGSQSTLNQLNTSVILDRIRSEGNISRTGLSKRLSLSLPAISRIVDVLIDKGYVIEEGFGESSGGKKPKMLKFNSCKSYVIGIAIDVNFIDIILSDLSGNEIKHIHKDFLKDKKPSSIIDILKKYVEKIVNESEIDMDMVGVVSIGIPGMIEKNTGLVKMIPTIPSWEGKNLGKILAKRTGRKIILDNICNVSLLGERWKGKAKGCKNMVFIGIGTGIGAGILINGRIYRGFMGSAGEIGYMFIDRNLDKKVSDPQGQFEFFASNTRLNLIIKEICERQKIHIDESDYEKRLLQKSDQNKKLFEIIDDFAYGVANIIAILNPELIVIEGGLFQYSDEALKYLIRKVSSISKFETKIIRSNLGKKSITLGAVKSGMDFLDKEVFSPLFT